MRLATLFVTLSIFATQVIHGWPLIRRIGTLPPACQSNGCPSYSACGTYNAGALFSSGMTACEYIGMDGEISICDYMDDQLNDGRGCSYCPSTLCSNGTQIPDIEPANCTSSSDTLF